MKNILTKVNYMAFGCLLTLIGYHFGNVDNNSANAQENTPIVDEVRCRRLVIVGADNTPRVSLGVDSFDRGMVEIGDEHRTRRVYLGVDAISGKIHLNTMDSRNFPGSVSVMLGTDLYGGYMTLFNRNPASLKPDVHASITSNERGAIVLRDTIGQVTDTMYGSVPGEVFQIREIERKVNFHRYLRN